MGKSEESYFELIDRCAKEKADFTIQNGDARHASYLMKTFFKNAESTVSIFTGSLNSDVFDKPEITDAAIEYLKKGREKKLIIAYQEKIPSETLLAKSFLTSIAQAKEIKGTVEVWNASSEPSDDCHHFAVMDRSAFRFEINHKATQAVANFGDKKNAEVLSDIFSKIVSRASQVYPVH